MTGLAGGNDAQLAQIQLRDGGLRQSDMAPMRRVKSPAKDADAQAAFARITALRAVFVKDCEHIGRGRSDDRGAKILDQGDLPRGHSGRGGHHHAAQSLGPVVKSKAAGEQPIAIGKMHDIGGCHPGRAQRPRHQLRPDVQIGAGIAHDRRLARGAG